MQRFLRIFLLCLLALPCAAVGVYDRGFGAEQPAGTIRDAIEFQGELYVGGDFLIAGRRDCPYVAKFVDGRWVKPLGYPSGPVERFLEHEGTLYIVGNFRDPQGRARGYVAAHDGENWNRIGGLFANGLNTLAIVDGQMFAGGRGIFRWDGSTWLQEAGITTAELRWIAPLSTELYAGHSSGSLYRRNGNTWERMDWRFLIASCSQLSGPLAGPLRSVLSRDFELLIVGDFWWVDSGSGTAGTESAGIVSFDGQVLQGIPTPWIGTCYEQRSVESPIYDIAAIGPTTFVTGRLNETPPPISTISPQRIATDLGGEWSVLHELSLGPLQAQLAAGATSLYVLNAAAHRSSDDDVRAYGRVLSIDPASLSATALYEPNNDGQLLSDGRPAEVVSLATHYGAVIVGGSGSLPVGLEVSTGEGLLPALSAKGRSGFRVPRMMRPTALLSTERGLYAADADIVIRSDGTDAGGILISELIGPGGGAVRAMAEFADELILGGEFTQLDATLASRLARLDVEGTIHPMGDPDGPVFALAYFEDSLVAAGQFTSIGGVDAASIARWDGSQWSPMGDGFTNSLFAAGIGRVEALCVYQGALYAAGDLRASGANTSIFHIARWDGAAWNALADVDLNSPARSLIEHDGLLFVGGDFLYAGGEFVGHLAWFDGDAWHNTEAYADGSIRAMATLDGDLYLGGDFTLLDGFYSLGLGRWRAQERPEPEIPPTKFSFRGVMPNPFNPRAELVFSLPRNGPIDVEIFDARGRIVRTLRRPYVLAGEARIVWDGLDDAGDDVASGTYFLRARFAGEEQTRRATLLR